MYSGSPRNGGSRMTTKYRSLEGGHVMSYHLTLSHVGIFVTDMPKMVDFYTGFLGFAESDRGATTNGGDIVFLTPGPGEPHRVVLATGRPADLPYNIVNQLSFRVDSLDTLRELQRGI